MPARARDQVVPALESLFAHRLRTTLSALGMVGGIATVVAAVAIGEGARREAVAEIGALGVNNLFVRAVRSADSTPAPAPALTVADARVLELSLPDIEAVAVLRSAPTTIETAAGREPATLVGVSPSWRAVLGARLRQGRWLTSADAVARRRVAVASEDMVARLFGTTEALGEPIRAGGVRYTLVGVLASRESSGRLAALQGFDSSRALYVPLGAMDLTLGAGDSIERVEQIALRTSGPAALKAASISVPAALSRRQLATGTFEVVVPRELLAARMRAERTFGIVLLAVGALALIISGVGIMNIMLASVAERAHEIGVRRAFGASRRDIAAQFAVEAAALCLAGGSVGVPAGALLSALIAHLAGWPVAVSVWAVGLSLALATAVGLACGIYPALRASKVDPVDALRRA